MSNESEELDYYLTDLKEQQKKPDVLDFQTIGRLWRKKFTAKIKRVFKREP